MIEKADPRAEIARDDTLIARLLAPVDLGGYDGFEIDGLHASAAHRLAALHEEIARLTVERDHECHEKETVAASGQAFAKYMRAKVAKAEAEVARLTQEREDAREEVSRYGVAFGHGSHRSPEYACRVVLEQDIKREQSEAIAQARTQILAEVRQIVLNNYIHGHTVVAGVIDNILEGLAALSPDPAPPQGSK